jgi:threonyl-tRNA synthetase
VDFAMPERFGMAYVDSAGERRRAVMLHRALYGSIERFLGVLLEHHGGKLPVWLAPEQAHVLAVGASEAEYAREPWVALDGPGVRAVLTDPAERLASRVAAAREAGAPSCSSSDLGGVEPRGRVGHGGAAERRPFDSAVEGVAAAARA